jgi:transposase
MSKTKSRKKKTGQLIIRGITQDNATKLIEFLARGALESEERPFETADFWPQNEMDDYTDAVIAAMLIAKNTAPTKDRKKSRRPQQALHRLQFFVYSILARSPQQIRANLIRMRSSVKNRVHAYLLMNNIKIDGSPFTKGFLNELRKVADTRIEGYIRIIERLNLEIHEASKLICSEALSDENAGLLMTIPGISFYSALLIISEIGDISRFPDSSHLVSYAGLVSSTHSSGGTTYHGRITKTGSSYLRWVLNQCTWVHIRNQPEGSIAVFYDRLRKKKGHSKATVAASAKLLKVVYWVLKEKRPYQS